MVNQLNPILARAHTTDLLRAAAEERRASELQPPHGRLASLLARRRPAHRGRRLPALRAALHH
jgi:hypothetical protein